MNEEYKLKGWVARDEDNAVFFHIKQPHREPMVTFSNERIGIWQSYNEKFRLSHLDKMFSELAWNDEPIEVELTIKKI